MAGPLITAADLRALRAAAPVLLDVRWDVAHGARRDEFTAGHLPGAVFVDLDAVLAAPPAPGSLAGRHPGGRHPLPEPAVFLAAMRAAGVSRSRPVVVYDATGGMAAARAWWLLRHYGHPDVRLLDGGLPAYVAAGASLASGAATSPAPGDFDGMPGQMAVLDAAAAARLATDGILLDARAPERFAGETEPVDPVAGHIPGARSAPASTLLTDDGQMRAPGDLRAVFAAVGAGPRTPIGAYCGSGVTAAHTVLALEVGGLAAALYPGSWSDWISDPSRPLASGA